MLSSLKAPVAIIQNYIAGLYFICISFKHSAFCTRFLYIALLHCSHVLRYEESGKPLAIYTGSDCMQLHVKVH